MAVVPFNIAGSPIPQYRGPANVGSVTAVTVNEVERFDQRGVNDFINDAQSLEGVFGTTQSGRANAVDVAGNLSAAFLGGGNFEPDIDTYRVRMEAGDILDIATYGVANNFTVLLPNGRTWFGVDGPTGFVDEDGNVDDIYPISSPLQSLVGGTLGSNLAQVVPESGTYFIQIIAGVSSGAYQMGLRAYRPSLELSPQGTQQKILLDFEGGPVPLSAFGSVIPGGPLVTQVDPFEFILQDIGVVATPEQVDGLIENITERVRLDYGALASSQSTGTLTLGSTLGTNGDFVSTGIGGQFGVQVFSSRSPEGAELRRTNDPTVTRVILAGDLQSPVAPFGRAQSLDVGNFDPSELGAITINSLFDFGLTTPIGPLANQFDAIAEAFALVLSHEAGHTFGMIHTDTGNRFPNINDAGGSPIETVVGVGPDGLFGTEDDEPLFFQVDRFNLNEGIAFGTEFVPQSLSHVLSVGGVGTTTGGTIQGTVFLDAGAPGVFTGDVGQPGITVFLEADGISGLTAGDLAVLTDANGVYRIAAPPGEYTLFLQVPNGVFASTPVAVPVTIGATGLTGGPSFGLVATRPLDGPSVTGRKVIDVDLTASLTTPDIGVEGAYIYADIDGDNAPDTSEPFAITDANGFYSLSLVGFEGRTFAIRETQTPGLQPTFPTPITPDLPLPAGFSPLHRSGEYVVTYNGGSLGGGFNFGGRVASDFSDAPASYGNASHTLLAGLSIGATVDAESAAFNTAAANGDDLDGSDDEDGVTPLLPLVPGATGTINVATTNSTGGPAFLQGWVDFNADGDFSDPGEQVASNLAVGTGTTQVTFTVPAAAATGMTVSRFRISQTTGTGISGPAGPGEVEDTQLLISANANVVNDDTFAVSSNTSGNRLDVLANDLSPATAPLNITAGDINTAGTRGTVSVIDGGGPTGQDILSFTPSPGFIGATTFTYFATDALGMRRGPAVVTVNVGIGRPTAVDDIFQIDENVDVPLNVIGNDLGPVAERAIVSVTQPTTGGSVRIESSNNTIIYNPGPNSPDTEQFTYQIQARDAAGNLATSDPATVTVVRLPQSLANDEVLIDVAVLDPATNAPVSMLRVGDEFLVRISVDDLRGLSANQEGVASAVLDLLYTNELVRPTGSAAGGGFTVESVGSFFADGTLRVGDVATPGLVNEFGAFQQVTDLQNFGGPVELLTLRFTATAAGPALFEVDPAESGDAVVLVGREVSEPITRIRFGATTLAILPTGAALPVAIDDAFSDGLDSDGVPFLGGNGARLDVLANDLFDGGRVQGISITPGTGPANGTAVVNNNGTPGIFSDDFIVYTPNATGGGFDSFSYTLRVDDGADGTSDDRTSTAQVTLRNGEIVDPLAGYALFLTDGEGRRLTSNRVTVGQRFGIEIEARDLRRAPDIDTSFAGFLDFLYTAGLVTPANTNQLVFPELPNSTQRFGDDDFSFDVRIDPQFNQESAVGVNNNPGIIDEFGTLLADSINSDIVDIISGVQIDTDNNTLATIFFNANAVGSAVFNSSPADVSPFQDTLLFQRDQPVPVSQIQYDQLIVEITNGSGEPLHNSRLPQDVNADGSVSAIDALLIINEVQRLDSASGQGESASGSRPLRFVDVNNDGKASPIDALRVINYLNKQTASSEPMLAAASEPILVASGTVAVPVGSAAIAAAMSTADVPAEDLSSAAKVVGGLSGDVDPGAVIGSISPSAADSEDDDVLSLLADDVAGVWA